MRICEEGEFFRRLYSSGAEIAENQTAGAAVTNTYVGEGKIETVGEKKRNLWECISVSMPGLITLQ